MNEQQSNVEFVQRLLSTPIDQFDVQAFAEKWLAEDMTLLYPGGAPIPFARLWSGRKGFVEFMSTMAREVKMLNMEVGTCEGAGDNVYIPGVTHAQVLKTGKSYRSAWMLMWTFRNGKVARMVEYHDTQAIANAFT